MRILLVILLQFYISTVYSETKVTLVSNGKSNYKIIISSKATDEEVKAAKLLKEYFLKISSADLDIMVDDKSPSAEEIVIGNTNRFYAPVTKEDAFLIKTEKEKLFILGGNGKGVIFGVTEFLEKYIGCRKYSPDVEFIPQRSNIVLDEINDFQVPVSPIRIINGELCNDESYRDWRKLSSVTEKWGSGAFAGYFVHTFNKFVPHEIYFASHPEYFSMIDGVRVPYGQLCLTNPEVFKITVEKLREEFSKNPQIKYWSVSQNDNYEHCTCPDCRKIDELEESPSGSLIRFVNQVAETFPDKIITTLAYQYSRKPPKITKPESNVMITLCTIELNRNEPIASDITSRDFVRDIKGWSNICKNIMLWDYEVQFTNYLSPFPLFHTLKPNIEFFNAHNVTAHFQQANVQHGNEFAELKSYLISKLLWNPKIEVDSIIDEFISGYYGSAGRFIRQYFDLLHIEGVKSRQRLDIYDSPTSYANTFISEDHLLEYKRIFDLAEKAVISDSACLERVKIARLPIMYSELEIAKSDIFGKRGFYNLVNGKYVINNERKIILEEFLSILDRNHIPNLNETNLTPDLYSQNMKRILDIKTENNFAFQKNVITDPEPALKYSSSGPKTLTNGVQGTQNHKSEWLGWENIDASITIDLEKPANIDNVTVSTLQNLTSWITHPVKISCWVSLDNISYLEVGNIHSDSDLRKEKDFKKLEFQLKGEKIRFIKLNVEGTKVLPKWHLYAGNKSWIFIDEIIAR